MNGRMLRDMPALSPRADEIRWATAEPNQRRAKISQTGSGFARRNGARPFNIAMRPNSSQAEPQIGTRPFLVREDLCVPKIPYCNVLAAAVSTEDAPPPAPNPTEAPSELILVPAAEMVRHEENFDSGWDNWVGGMADWKVDVAGVRTGSLRFICPRWN